MYEKFLLLLERKGQLFGRKYSISDVARATGIGQSTFSNWKKRGTSLSTRNLSRLASFFDVPMEFFMKEED